MIIEPMSIEDIKYLVEGSLMLAGSGKIKIESDDEALSLVLAWAYERAEKNRLTAWCNNWRIAATTSALPPLPDIGRHDWLEAVLDEIGWPKDQR